MKSIYIKEILYRKLLDSFSFENEDGGILGGTNEEITEFYFLTGDKKDIYDIDTQKFSEVCDEWDKKDISFLGFIHSHLGCTANVSVTDFNYVYRFMKSNDWLEKLLFFIIIKNKNGEKEILPFVYIDNDFVLYKLVIIR